MNLATLKPVSSRPPAERKALASKAGRASGRRRKELKAAREVMRTLLTLPLKDFSEENTEQSAAAAWLEAQGVKEKDQTQLLALLFTLHRRALRGDVRAIESVLKIAGEWDPEKIEITTAQEPETQYRFIDLTPEQANKMIHEYYDKRDQDRAAEEEKEKRRFERERRMILYRAGILPEDEKKTATEEGDGQENQL